MTVYEVYFWITILLCIGIFQNSLGDLLLGLRNPAIMNFKIARQRMVSRYARWYRFFYDSPGVWWVKIGVILCAALSICVLLLELNPTIPLVLIFLLQLLSHPRWQLFVTSDSPLLRAVLFALILYYTFPQNEVIAEMGLFFVSAYVSLIYFFTSVQKFKSQAWRNGVAMIHFANKSPFWVRSGLASGSNWFLKTTTWGVIFFELLFFSGLFSPQVAIAFMIIGFLFHGVLSLSMGINHFFWTFLACYPAYFYASGKILLLMS